MSETNNNRVPLRELIELRFDTLEEKLDTLSQDHEERLRCLEKQSPWRTLSEIAAGAVAVVALALGFRK
jgi:hypothetical protein